MLLNEINITKEGIEKAININLIKPKGNTGIKNPEPSIKESNPIKVNLLEQRKEINPGGGKIPKLPGMRPSLSAMNSYIYGDKGLASSNQSPGYQEHRLNEAYEHFKTLIDHLEGRGLLEPKVFYDKLKMLNGLKQEIYRAQNQESANRYADIGRIKSHKETTVDGINYLNETARNHLSHANQHMDIYDNYVHNPNSDKNKQWETLKSHLEAAKLHNDAASWHSLSNIADYLFPGHAKYIKNKANSYSQLANEATNNLLG